MGIVSEPAVTMRKKAGEIRLPQRKGYGLNKMVILNPHNGIRDLLIMFRPNYHYNLRLIQYLGSCLAELARNALASSSLTSQDVSYPTID